MKKRWQKKRTPDVLVKTLATACKIDTVIARLLVQRGIRTADAAERFLNPSLDYLHPPFLMKNMDKAVQRLDQAIARNETILLFGDYDVDGTVSVAMMFQFLRQYTPHLHYYIPNRYREGYGLSKMGIDKAVEQGCTLLVAMDCGVKAVKEVEYARSKNINVIICDHHTPGDHIPDAHAVLDPLQKDCAYPFKKLCGCGVSFKLAQAFAQHRNDGPEKWYHLLDLVAIATACDIVPLVDENRVLTHAGLKQLNDCPRSSIAPLLAERKRAGEVKVSDLVFGVGPVLNAAGRLDDARAAVQLLLEENFNQIQHRLQHLIDQNEQRKAMDKKTFEQARAIWEALPDKHTRTSIVLYHPDWHKGVVGIVASRMVEQYHRPVVLLTQSNGQLTGSARSVSNFNLYQAIDNCKEWLENFGGHQYAAGVTLLEQHLDAFKQAFEQTIRQTITPLQQSPMIPVAEVLPLEKIDLLMVEKIRQLAPFGPKNRNPIFASKNLTAGDGTRVLKNDHLKLQLQLSKNKTVDGIGFGLGQSFGKCMDGRFSVCYTLERNTWRGQSTVQLNIKDIR